MADGRNNLLLVLTLLLVVCGRLSPASPVYRIVYIKS